MRFVDATGVVRYLGAWRGRVVNNQDPEGQFKIRMYAPDVYKNGESPWAIPGSMQPGQSGVPEVGAQVIFELEQGDPNKPIWKGVVPSAKGGAQAASPTSLGEDDETVAVAIGKGGGAVQVPDPDAPGGQRELLEPITPAQPEYPNIKELRVGQNIIEVDGTPGQERINIYHQSGAYYEIGPTGSVRRVSRGQEHNWAKGSRTDVVTGQRTESVSGKVVEDFKQGVERTIAGGSQEILKGGDKRTVTGNVEVEVQDGKVIETFHGLHRRSAGAVEDIALGGRNQSTGGTFADLVSGAYLLTVQNKDFLKGQRIGYGVALGLGDFEFDAKTGDFAFKTKLGTLSLSKAGALKYRGVSVALGNGVVELLDLFDKTLDALAKAVTLTALGPQPLSAVPELLVVKTALATIKGAT